MSTLLAVVADSARARIFDFDKSRRTLLEREDLVHPESRLKAQDMNADHPGSTSDPSGAGRHGVDSRSDPKDVEKHEFAQELAHRISAAVNTQHIDNLILMAEPAFLGELRRALPEKIRHRVVLEIDKDLSNESNEEILQHIPKFFG